MPCASRMVHEARAPTIGQVAMIRGWLASAVTLLAAVDASFEGREGSQDSGRGYLRLDEAG